MTAPLVLKLERVTKSWTTKTGIVEILKGIDLELRKGDQVALVGPSGSGKSTLLALMAALDRPTHGRVMIGSSDTNYFSAKELTRWRGKNLGIVFQQFHLMPSLTALENVALPLEIAGDRQATPKAKKALADVSLSHRLDHFPSTLSGGECQRVAIARALVTEPQLLLADEPSGSLDVETGRQIIDLLFELSSARQMTMVIVTHNLEVARQCQKIFKIEGGQLVEIQGV